MNRIYTGTGDKGTTAIHGGVRVPKTDVRIEANGCIDELNVAVGFIRTSLRPDHEWQYLLRGIQLNLMTVMSLVATRSDMRESNPNKLPDDLVDALEGWNHPCTLDDRLLALSKSLREPSSSAFVERIFVLQR